MTTVSFTTVLLAAGLSRRMEPRNKLLERLAGVPLVRHVAETLLSGGMGRVTVVLGHEADAVAQALSGLPVRLTHNPDFATGQTSSVHWGLATAPSAHTTLLALADQPRLTPADLMALRRSHLHHGSDRITVPVRHHPLHGDQRGNPILIPAPLRTRLTKHDVALGYRKLTRTHPELVHAASLMSDGFYRDLDTPEAFVVERLHLSEPIKEVTAHDPIPFSPLETPLVPYR